MAAFPNVMRVINPRTDQANMSLGFAAGTVVEWRRPDGAALSRRIADAVSQVPVVLYHDGDVVLPPYDMYVARPGAGWERAYEIRSGPHGAIDVNRPPS